MSFLEINNEEIKETSGAEYINKSGIYKIEIDYISVQTNEQGARVLDINYNYKGNPSVIYGLRLDNNDGTPNFQMAVFKNLCVIAGIKSVDSPVTHTKVVGKDKTPKDFDILEQFSGLEVVVRVKYEYSIYNAEIKEKRAIVSVFRANDNASAFEIVNNKPFGTAYNKELKYADDVTYKDGLTPQKVEEWKENGRSSVPKTSNGTAKVASDDEPF